jgi:hypothetical protein
MKLNHSMFPATVCLLLAAQTPGISQDANGDKHLEGVKGIYIDRGAQPARVGSKFHILREGPDHKRSKVAVTTEFHSGDRIWLDLEVRTATYVYVINRTLAGSSDKGIEIVRDEDRQVERVSQTDQPSLVFAQRIEPGKSRVVPSEPAAMKFDNTAGIEKLYVILSETEIPELTAGFDQAGQMRQNKANKNGKNDTNASALQSLDTKLAKWKKNADVAIPQQGTKAIVLDNNGYAVERNHGEPMMIELTLRHSA